MRPPRRLAAVRTIIVAVVLAAISGCAEPTRPTPSTPELASGTTTQDGITLSAVAEPATVAPGEVIDVTATLSHEGPGDLELSGSGTGIVFFSVTRIEDGLSSGSPIGTGDCARHVLPAQEPAVIPFSKSGGYSPEDPNAAFMEAYNAHPLLTLPPGRWRIDVATSATIGPGCTGEQLDLDVGLIVTVSD